MDNLKKKLSSIQRELKAPKNLYNSFGKYKYRNVEGILEAFKPFEKKYNVALTIDDDINVYGDRVYVRATATLWDCESEQTIVASALARESETKKGMDDSQITGSTSSYARKYALNGLFLLDDTKDEDSEELQTEKDARFDKEIKEKVSDIKDTEKIASLLMDNKLDKDYICKLYKVKDLKSLNAKQREHIANNIDELIKRQEDNKNE